MVQAKVEVTKTKIKNKQKQTNEQTNKIKERNDVRVALSIKLNFH